MSSDYKIHIAESRAAELRKQADALGITVNTLMTQILEERVTLTPSIDVAAGVFLSYLEPEHRKLILECADENKRSPAAYLMSYIQLARDRGETTLPVGEGLDPSLTAPLSAVPNAERSPSICEWCHHAFTPEREGQRYCPAPDDGESCGRQASLAALRATRAQKSDSTIPAPHIVERLVRA